MTDVKKIIRQLNLGILPNELNFNLSPIDEIDWSKVQYNTFYKSPDYIVGKFPNPNAFMNLPGADIIIEDIINNTKTPLEEMLERQSKYFLGKSMSKKKLSNDIIIDELPEANPEQPTN